MNPIRAFVRELKKTKHIPYYELRNQIVLSGYECIVRTINRKRFDLTSIVGVHRIRLDERGVFHITLRIHSLGLS